MATESRDPFASGDDYRREAEALERRLAGDERALDLLASLERILAYEIASALPDEERLLGRLLGRGASGARRTALISDIHGNLPGLAAVFEDIERCGCDRILCLGDLVDGGDHDEEVVDSLRKRGIRSVRGNHDENNDLRLAAATQEYLARLPEYIVEGDVVYTHISPRKRKRKVNHSVEAWNAFEDASFRVAFIGHAHVPLVFARRCERHGEATPVDFEYNRPVPLAPDERYIVCVGSVGYGRDEVGKLRYAIHDRGAGTVELRAVDGPLLQMDHSLRLSAAGPLELVPVPDS